MISERHFETCNNFSAFNPPLKSCGQLWGQGSIWGLRALPRGPQCFQDLSVQNKLCTITTTLTIILTAHCWGFFSHHYQANQAEIAKQYYIQLARCSIDSNHYPPPLTLAGRSPACMCISNSTLYLKGMKGVAESQGGKAYINKSFFHKEYNWKGAYCMRLHYRI